MKSIKKVFKNRIEYINSNGKTHREDGPAVIYDDGSKEWWVNGKLHRTDGPAIEYVNGEKIWYVNGKLHRTDGPAIEDVDDEKIWYINNLWYDERDYWRKLYEMGLITKTELMIKLL